MEKKFEGKISTIEITEKIDLEVINHLSGIKTKFLKLSFKTISVKKYIIFNIFMFVGFSYGEKYNKTICRT